MAMKRGDAGATYVQLTREEFEEWLDSTPYRGKWTLKSGTVGVYSLELSKNVGIEVSSSISGREEVMDRARASIQCRLVSLVTGQTLNKKAQGQSHVKRTSGWRQSLKKVIQRIEDAYFKSEGFYERIAVIEDRKAYQRDWLDRIESQEDWASDSAVKDFHDRIEKGAILSERQEEYLSSLLEKVEEEVEERIEQEEETAQYNEDFLEALRNLYRAARKARDNWLMEFVESVGKQYKTRGSLSDKQMAVLERNAEKYRVRLVQASEEKEMNGQREAAQRMIRLARSLVAEKREAALSNAEWTLMYMTNNDTDLPTEDLISDLTHEIGRNKAKKLVTLWFKKRIQLITNPFQKDIAGSELIEELGI
jgi:hypothetical protein